MRVIEALSSVGYHVEMIGLTADREVCEPRHVGRGDSVSSSRAGPIPTGWVITEGESLAAPYGCVPGAVAVPAARGYPLCAHIDFEVNSPSRTAVAGQPPRLTGIGPSRAYAHNVVLKACEGAMSKGVLVVPAGESGGYLVLQGGKLIGRVLEVPGGPRMACYAGPHNNTEPLIECGNLGEFRHCLWGLP